MKFALQLLRCWVLPALTGVFYAFALPPYNQGELAWIALIPLLFAIESSRPAEAFRRGYVAGLVFFSLTTWWIIHVSLPGMVALIAFLALYFGLAGLLIQWVAGRNNSDSVGRNFLAAVVSAAVWVTLEWVRGAFPLGGFGWNGLGVTQHALTPVFQFARFTGVYGVSALVYVINFGLYCTIRRYLRNLRSGTPTRRLSWEFYGVMTLFCLAMFDGVAEIKNSRQETVSRALRLALVQGNIPQNLKFDESQKPLIFDRYRTLTETATWTQVDLIIWPETATPDAVRYDADTFALVTNVTAKSQANLLTGTIDFTPRSVPVEAFNAAALIRPDGIVAGIYRKIHLVPFGEYVPLRKIGPFLKWFTPVTDSFERGHDTTLFNVRGFTFGAVICFEDTLPDLYRRFVKRGADFMVNLTNDAWFKDSPAAEIHLANAVFRAVENRRRLVRCSNHGVTCLIDSAGFVRHQAAPFTPATLAFTLLVPRELPQTFYTQQGDVFVGGCALVALVGVALACRAATRTNQSVPSGQNDCDSACG